MKTLGTLLATATVVAFAAAAPSPKAEDLAKNYGKLLTRVTEQPQMIGRDFSLSCSGRGYAEFHKKLGPHLSFWVHYYRNDLAQGAEAGALPVGSVIVKEKQARERREALLKPEQGALKTHAIAGMIKRPAGTFPKSGDWEFFWFEDGKLSTTGLESCAGCHSGAKRDYVFTELPKKAK